MKGVINVVTRIEYDWELNCTSMDDKVAAAIDLAFNPNFHTKMNGVTLQSVHVEPVEPHKLIDWDKVEHNPEQIYINQ